ncbi:MAG: hypothetical protein KDJ52_06505 [Anaerolineae bacterium]|nr:hypothetical protein [Anaerolineae bacterium]
MSQKFLFLLISVVLSLWLLTACGGAVPAQSVQAANNGGSQATVAANGPDTDGDSIPDSAEATLGTDPNNSDTDGDGQNDLTDPQPMLAENPTQEAGTTDGFTITSILVENNVNPTGGDAPDHLELTLSSQSTTDLTDFDVYYTIKDLTTNDTQAYYRTLPGFSLKPGESKTVHFDNTGQPDHFSVNPNSMFYTDPNQLQVEATLHAKGFAPQTASVNKDASDAETGTD